MLYLKAGITFTVLAQLDKRCQDLISKGFSGFSVVRQALPTWFLQMSKLFLWFKSILIFRCGWSSKCFVNKVWIKHFHHINFTMHIRFCTCIIFVYYGWITFRYVCMIFPSVIGQHQMLTIGWSAHCLLQWLLHGWIKPRLLKSFQWSNAPIGFFELLSTKFAACLKPRSRDNHRKTLYWRMQQHDLGAGWTQILHSWLSLKLHLYPFGRAANSKSYTYLNVPNIICINSSTMETELLLIQTSMPYHI